MKRKIIAATTLLTAISLFAPTAVFSQPTLRGDLEITDTEAQASVNPNLPIKIKLLNQTVKLIEYARSNSYPQPLPPGETVELLVKNNPDEDYLASILYFPRAGIAFFTKSKNPIFNTAIPKKTLLHKFNI